MTVARVLLASKGRLSPRGITLSGSAPYSFHMTAGAACRTSDAGRSYRQHLGPTVSSPVKIGTSLPLGPFGIGFGLSEPHSSQTHRAAAVIARDRSRCGQRFCKGCNFRLIRLFCICRSWKSLAGKFERHAADMRPRSLSGVSIYASIPLSRQRLSKRDH